MHWQLKAIPFAIVAVMLMAGCGQATYDARMAAAPAMIKKRTEAGDSKALTPEFFSVTDTASAKQGVKFKLPAAFSGDAAKSLAADAPNARNPLVDIPGLLYAIQITVPDDAGKQVPAYCYLHSVKKAEKQRAEIEESIKATLVQLQPTIAWQPVTKPNRPAGGAITYSGNFDFAIDGMNQNLPGQLAIHSFETDVNTVFVAWLTENKSATKANLTGAISKSMDTAVADTAEAAAPAPAPAPATP
jgi:hypothetical protein